MKERSSRVRSVRMAALCQRTIAVGAAQGRVVHAEPYGVGCLEVDEEVFPGRLHGHGTHGDPGQQQVGHARGLPAEFEPHEPVALERPGIHQAEARHAQGQLALIAGLHEILGVGQDPAVAGQQHGVDAGGDEVRDGWFGGRQGKGLGRHPDPQGPGSRAQHLQARGGAGVARSIGDQDATHSGHELDQGLQPPALAGGQADPGDVGLGLQGRQHEPGGHGVVHGSHDHGGARFRSYAFSHQARGRGRGEDQVRPGRHEPLHGVFDVPGQVDRPLEDVVHAGGVSVAQVAQPGLEALEGVEIVAVELQDADDLGARRFAAAQQ